LAASMSAVEVLLAVIEYQWRATRSLMYISSMSQSSCSKRLPRIACRFIWISCHLSAVILVS
jgi:hypothetical protein